MLLKVSKYNECRLIKRMGIVFLFLLIQNLLQAQSSEAVDTVPVLKYEIDTTVLPPPQEEQPGEEVQSEVAVDEKMPETEYFLRKEFTGNFTDSFKLQKLPDSFIKRLQNDDAFWYANEVFRKREPKKPTRSFIDTSFFQTLLWFIIIGGFATFLIMYLYNSNAGLFRKSQALDVEEYEFETNDIFAINYQKEIDKAISTGDYRLAVRLMFLRLLKNLSERNIIQYKQDNTNFDYLLQLQSTGMYPDFFRITRNYEYSWYGQFEIDKDKFDMIKKDFDHFDRKLY